MQEHKHSLELLIDSITASTVNEVFASDLAARINNMIECDFPGLVQLVYRLDIPEQRLKQVISDQPGEDAGKLIAELIIERQLQKAKLRAQFKNNTDIDEAERW